jgi:hypothetical protein
MIMCWLNINLIIMRIVMKVFYALLIVLQAQIFSQAAQINQIDLKKIEVFLSTMNTLQASVKMEIFHDTKLPPAQQFEGKIWLDRARKFLRIDYGNSKIIAKDGWLVIKEANEIVQEFKADDTPAGLLLRPSIKFDDGDIKVLDMKSHEDMLMLALSYTSPVGDVPVTLYFKNQQVMLLLGWTIQNPDGTVTQVHLNPDDTHMAMPIDASVFE